MAADYLLSGCKWAGPRKGINWAGYIAWAVGFVVAILPNDLVAPETFGFITPAPVIAFVIGFVLYYVLAKAGLEPPVVEMAAAPAEATPEQAPAEAKAAPEQAPAETKATPTEAPAEEAKEDEKEEKSE
jgi:hypothetical protein